MLLLRPFGVSLSTQYDPVYGVIRAMRYGLGCVGQCDLGSVVRHKSVWSELCSATQVSVTWAV